MIYKRKGEETVKQCDSCDTVWKDSWLENYQDENECPMCGTEFEEGEIKVLEPIKNKPKDKLYYLRMNQIELQSKIEITQAEMNMLESTHVFAGDERFEVPLAVLERKHAKDLTKLTAKRKYFFSLKTTLADINGQIDKLRVI